MPRKPRWKATVFYLIDGTTHDRTFAGRRISTQVFDDTTPRRALIQVRNKRGEVTEVFQCDYQAIHKERIR